MKKLITIYAIATCLIACTKNNSSETSTEKLIAASIDCENRSQTNWCAQNLLTSSDVNTVCKGVAFSDDIIYDALFLKSDSKSTCFLDMGSEVKYLTMPGCSNAYRRTFTSSTGTSDVLFCQSSTGVSTYVEGKTSEGIEFRSIYME